MQEYDLIVLDAGEYDKLEYLGSGQIQLIATEKMKTEILSGKFRDVVGNFHYVKDYNAIAILKSERHNYGFKPAKAKK